MTRRSPARRCAVTRSRRRSTCWSRWDPSSTRIFHVDSAPVSSPELDELAQHSGTAELQASRTGLQIVARLDASSAAARGQLMELSFDPDRLHLFDAASGLSVLADGGHRSEQTAMVPIATP